MKRRNDDPWICRLVVLKHLHRSCKRWILALGIKKDAMNNWASWGINNCSSFSMNSRSNKCSRWVRIIMNSIKRIWSLLFPFVSSKRSSLKSSRTLIYLVQFLPQLEMLDSPSFKYCSPGSSIWWLIILGSLISLTTKRMKIKLAWITQTKLWKLNIFIKSSH